MKDSTRSRRVAELIKRELAQIIARELHDPHTQRVTLTGATVTADLSSARVYFSLLSGSDAAKPAVAALNRAAGFLRHALTRRLTLRTVPELRFHFDESVERGARIATLIDRALAEDGGNGTKQSK
jgi:ribosome-binding factor A